MKVIKNINNNVSLCIDSNGNELIAFGKGIGFKTPPYEITDMETVHRTFYDVNPTYLELLNQIDDDVFEVAAQTIDYGLNFNIEFGSNATFTLADHIQFAIKRQQDNQIMKFSNFYDLNYMNPDEMKIASYSFNLIRDKLGFELPEEEKYGIALNLINVQSVEKKEYYQNSNDEEIATIVNIIEDYFIMTIDKNGFNYARFISHMEFFFKRYREGIAISSKNNEIFVNLKNDFPETYACLKLIENYLKDHSNIHLNDEERLYLMLHINRLCSREGCYR
ncbi:PRD domain-containing protein [Amphibacillus sp. Q70]|uniref:PRD domain-containing protein n=1 Tax=Amphibacillus sp. Q70 TaxID=3453416 RepID=UPI003F8779A8